MTLRWRAYSGTRIEFPGHRTFVEDAPTIRFGPITRRYGYVWPEGPSFKASFEVVHPGEIEDVALGAFESASEARRAVESALLAGSD